MRSSILIALFAVGCGSSSPGQSPDLAQPDLTPSVTCRQTGPSNAAGIPTSCDWTWDCSDFSGPSPEFDMHCTGAAGGDDRCECAQAGAVTATIMLKDACDSNIDAKTAANAACKFTRTIF